MKLNMKFIRNSNGRSLVVKATLIACLLALSWPAVAQAQDPPWPEECVMSELPKPAYQKILVCQPEVWNGVLVVYAHGYVAPQLELNLPAVELSKYPQLLSFLLDNHYAFATTSYSKNGYAVEQAGKDLNALVRYFKTHVLPNAGLLEKVFMVGASEGGLIATMLVEKHPDVYDGGLAMCGPIGGMPAQIQYLADFRAVFDYFFPDVFKYPPVTGSRFGIVDVPSGAHDSWPAYVGQIATIMPTAALSTTQVFSVTGAALDPLAPTSPISTTVGVLFYSIYGTNDMVDTAGGMPYDNQDTWYEGTGSQDSDEALNFGVERVDSDGRARAYVRRAYQPTGELYVPLVTLHNTYDPVVPYWHEDLYASRAASSGFYTPYPYPPLPPLAKDYGHCEFTAEEVLGAFCTLMVQAGVFVPECVP